MYNYITNTPDVVLVNLALDMTETAVLMVYICIYIDVDVTDAVTTELVLMKAVSGVARI